MKCFPQYSLIYFHTITITTRTCNNIHLNNPRILLAHKALRHHGPDIWNTLPNSLKQITLLTSFKRSLKETLLNQYIAN